MLIFNTLVGFTLLFCEMNGFSEFFNDFEA
jgi:hypothetical protein